MAHIAFLGLAMFVLWQARELIYSPTCVYCGRKVEHARDCPERNK